MKTLLSYLVALSLLWQLSDFRSGELFSGGIVPIVLCLVSAVFAFWCLAKLGVFNRRSKGGDISVGGGFFGGDSGGDCGGGGGGE
jgi:hypothetical protein